ncbi:MAG: hypothetical protein Q9162_000607 [Coniocarpon cinnabarinum]
MPRQSSDPYNDLSTTRLLHSLFNRSISQPGIRALILLITLVSLYTIYGSFNFYRDPLSIFFSEEHGYDRFYSARRALEADEFMDAAKANPDIIQKHLGRSGKNPAICATFITVGRDMEEEQYVDTAIGSMLANMSSAERELIHLKIFFADVPNPGTQHRSYPSLVMSGVADEVYTYKTSLPQNIKEPVMKNLVEFASNHHNPHALEKKSMHDYSHSINQCLHTTNAPYIAIFEDDIILADGWAARTLTNLRRIEEMMQDPMRRNPERGRVDAGRPNSWLYLRLFNQERSFGWAGGAGFRSNNVHIISLAISAPLFIILLVARRFLPRRLGRHLDGWVLFIVCGVSVPLFLWLFYASGKASLIGSPPGVHEEFFGCCSQALVYNRQHAQPLADDLIGRMFHEEGGRGDMITREFAWNRGLSRISAYPMVAQHIGEVTSADTDSEETKKIWSMEFESYSANKLAREHENMVGDLFGEDAVKQMYNMWSDSGQSA